MERDEVMRIWLDKNVGRRVLFLQHYEREASRNHSIKDQEGKENEKNLR